MIVVADSGPLHYLILLELTELLPRFYGQVFVPDAVLQELTASKAPQPVREWLSKPPAWLRFQSVAPDQLDLVTDDLDLGEREAIALAHLLGADLILIDRNFGACRGPPPASAGNRHVGYSSHGSRKRIDRRP